MNLLEFENERFGDVWNEETIKELQNVEVNNRLDCFDLLTAKQFHCPLSHAMTNDELYQEFQEANWNEYFDPAGTYKYCIWR